MGPLLTPVVATRSLFHLAPLLFTGRPIRILMTLCVSLRHGTLKHTSNSILEPHHIDALLLLCSPIAFAFAFSFPCHLHIQFILSVAAKAP